MSKKKRKKRNRAAKPADKPTTAQVEAEAEDAPATDDSAPDTETPVEVAEDSAEVEAQDQEAPEAPVDDAPSPDAEAEGAEDASGSEGDDTETEPKPEDEPEDEEEEDDAPPDPDTPPVQSVEHAQRILECLFFATTRPLSVKRLRQLLWPLDAEQVREAIEKMTSDCEERGLQVREVAGGYLMATRREYADWVVKLTRQRRRRPLTKTMHETLAIVAYRQPIIKAEIDSIRGVDSGGILRTLLDLELIDARDRREVIGRPLQYRSTKIFLKAFGLNSLAELPTIGELRELYSRSDEEEEAPEDEALENEAEETDASEAEAENVDAEVNANETTDVADETAANDEQADAAPE